MVSITAVAGAQVEKQVQKLTVSSVRADDHDDGNVAENTVDGDRGTRWSAKGDGRRIEWDLGAERDVARVETAFHNGASRVAMFDLEVSSDGTTFTPVLTGQRSSGTMTDLETFAFPTPVAARVVRYVGHKNTANDWNSLTEVEVWGTPSTLQQGKDPGGGDPASQVVFYPKIPLDPSDVFDVHVGSSELPVWKESHGRTIHVANFSGTGAIPIRVTVGRPVQDVQISPRQKKIPHVKDGNSFTFTALGPAKLIIFVTTDKGELDPLYLLVDEPEEVSAPTADGPHLRYLGPGVHAGTITLHDHDEVYLAPGALLNGNIVADNATQITVKGRGILRDNRAGGDAHAIELTGCHTGVLVDGITVLNLRGNWTTQYTDCEGVTVRNLKVFSFCENGDGVDPVGCRNFTIDRCLISTGDDAIAIKSRGSDVQGITVTGCVLETYPSTGAGEGGDGLKIGTESDCDTMSVIRVDDCDVVRAYGENGWDGHAAFSITTKQRAHVQDVRYRNVRVEGRIQHKDFEIRLLGPGSVSDVTLTDVTWEKSKDINLVGKTITEVRFENCKVAGQPLGQGDVHRKDAPSPTIVTLPESP
jgi:F5/8 type C domain/Glycosyl hydrolases family 28